MNDNHISTSTDEQGLRDEIDRLNKIIKALLNRAEEDMNIPRSDFSVFQATALLQDTVRKRTHELENALQFNTKITRALQEAKRRIEKNEQRLWDITSALGEGLIVLNQDATITFANTACCKMLGYDKEELIGKNSHQIFHHSYIDHTPYPIEKCPNMQVIHTRKPHMSDNEYYWRKDGTYFPVAMISTPIQLDDNQNGVVVAFHDITQSIQEKNRLREMQAAIEQSPASVLIVDKYKNILYANPQLCKSTGYTRDELNNKTTYLFRGDKTPGGAYSELWRSITSGQTWQGELLYRRKDGSDFWHSWHIAPVFDNHGAILHFVGVGEDITEKKKLEFILHEMSYLDGLTNIPNRRRFDDYLQQEWLRALRHKTPVAIIMGDIDFFKAYNDHLGHLAGDDALKSIAQILKQQLRRSADLLARYGGEEFACIIPDTTLSGALQIAEAMRQAVQNLQLKHPDSSVAAVVTMSFGVAYCIPADTNAIALLEAADTALYKAKNAGRNRVEMAELGTSTHSS